MEDIVKSKVALQAEVSQEHIHFRNDDCAEVGGLLAQAYQDAHPFPHAVIEDFLAPDILARVQHEFQAAEAGFFSNQ